MISNRAGKGLTARLMPTNRCLASMTAILAIGVTSALHAAPTAKRVWHDAPEPASNATLFFPHTFELQESVVKAPLTGTADSDTEWDWGSPWYRPTRVIHCVSGGEHGWRSGTGKRPTYYPDSLPPVANILSKEEIFDLLASLETGGNPNASNFSGPQSE